MPDSECFNATAEYGSNSNVSRWNRASMHWPRRRTIWSCQADKGALFTRYYLLETRWFSVYIHCFHTSDEDRALHDHPWSFVSLLLSSGYYEWTDQGRAWIPRFSLIYRPADWRHRVELKTPNTWTLVFRSPVSRDWGFWVEGKWMFWKDYGKEYCD